MKTSPRSLVSALAALMLLLGLASEASARRLAPPPPDGPVATMLAPVDGARLNAASLRVQALVAARQPDARRSFVFDGTSVPGRNAGHLQRVDIAIDDVVVGQATAWPCRRQLVVDLSVDLTGFADGPHTVRVTALQGTGRAAREATVTAQFTLDRSLPLAVPNRVEAAATPTPFACFAARDDDDDEDDDGGRPHHPDVHGRLVLAETGNGWDPEHDRLVLAAGGASLVLEPGALRCNRRERVCRFEDRSHPLVRKLTLTRAGDRVVRFRLQGGPLWPRDAVVQLRLGDDAGGIDLGTGARLARLALSLDVARRAQATIGASGGAVQTSAGGVTVRLDVPPRALTRDTAISITPLVTSPLPGAAAAHPGLKLEPAGLQFAVPATLTWDFGAGTVANETRLFLVTSALTKLPLGGHVAGRVLTASLAHFSTTQPGAPDASLTDRVAWAADALASSTPLSGAEMQSLLAIVADQQLAGCAADCIDLALVTARIEASVAATVAAECADPSANASRAAVTRLIELEQTVQQVGGSVPTLLACAEQMIGVLVTRLTSPPSPAADDPFLVEARELAEDARTFGLQDLATQALGKLAQGLRDVGRRLLDALAAAAGTPDEEAAQADARAGLEQAQLWVTTYAPDVVAVDLGLPQFLADALASLGGDMKATILATYTINGLTEASGWWFLNGNDPASWAFHPFPADLPLPATVGPHADAAGSVDVRFVRPQQNVLGVDANLVSVMPPFGGAYQVNFFAMTAISVQRAGILEVTLDPAWFRPVLPTTQSWTSHVHVEAYDALGGTFLGIARSFLPEPPLTTPVVFSQLPPGASSVQNQPLVLRVRSGRTLYLAMQLHAQSNVYSGEVAGAGRAITLTFRPGDGQTPTIVPLTVSTAEDTPVAVTLQGSSPSGDAIYYEVATYPAHGVLSGTAPNLVYTPAPNFHGTDTFTVVASDGDEVGPVTMTITVQPQGDTPQAFDQTVVAPPDVPTAIALTAIDPDGGPLTYELLTLPANGTLTGVAPNLTYVPAPGASGVETLTFRVHNAFGTSNVATITSFIGGGGPCVDCS